MKEEVFRCPHCNKEIPEVKEVVMNKWELVASVGIGIGASLIALGGPHGAFSWYGALGVGVVLFIAMIVLLPFLRKRRG